MIGMMGLMFWLSKHTKSYVLTLIAGIAIVLLPLLLALLGVPYASYFLLNPLLIGNACL